MKKVSKKQSKVVSIKDAIRKSAEKIKKRFPVMDKRLIEMYACQLIPQMVVSSDDDDKIDTGETVSKLNKYIDDNLNTMDLRIRDYVNEVQSNLAECPCSGGRR